MTTGGIILIAFILTIFALFSTVLAWGVHQTNTVLRERGKAKPVDLPAVPAATTDHVLRAA